MNREPVFDKPTFTQVLAWCEKYDGHPTEGWLTKVLDGTITLHEMREAIVQDRKVRTATEMVVHKQTVGEDIWELPTYRGWDVHFDDEDQRWYWEHEETGSDCRVFVEWDGGARVLVEMRDVNDHEPYGRGGWHDFPAHTAQALFDLVRPYIDDEMDSYEELSQQYPKPIATEVPDGTNDDVP